MDTTRQGTSVELSPSKGIDVARLEKELAAIWADMTAGRAEGEAGVMRACVLNLVVYSPAGEDRAKLDALLDEVYERSPSRALVIFAAREDVRDKLDAYVSTRCSLSTKGAMQVCGEQVTVEASGAAVGRAATAVEPLLVPDVPVFLWWRDIPHYEDKLFGRLVGLSDRLVIDSACFDNPREDLLRLSEIITENADRLAVSDLNWGSLTPLRSLVAGFWDVPDYRPLLERIDRVEVVYGSEAETPNEIPPAALLCAGWLMSRLGWTVADNTSRDKDGTDFRLNAGDGLAVELNLKSSGDSASGVGGLCALKIDAGPARFSVGYGVEGDRLETRARFADDKEIVRVIGFERQSDGQRLGGELLINERDRFYEEAIASAAELLKVFGAA